MGGGFPMYMAPVRRHASADASNRGDIDVPAYQPGVSLLDDASSEARRLGHTFVAPEHLLIAIASSASGVSRKFLEHHGLTADELRQTVATLHGPMQGPPSAAGEPISVGLRAEVAITDAILRAKKRNLVGVPFTADDLLNALLGDDVAQRGILATILAARGLTLAEARASIATFAAPVT